MRKLKVRKIIKYQYLILQKGNLESPAYTIIVGQKIPAPINFDSHLLQT